MLISGDQGRPESVSSMRSAYDRPMLSKLNTSFEAEGRGGFIDGQLDEMKSNEGSKSVEERVVKPVRYRKISK